MIPRTTELGGVGMINPQTRGALWQLEYERQLRETWCTENQKAVAAYNERVERDGVFDDDVHESNP